jgi:putative redox protein
MGACTGYDVVSILRKARQDVTDCRIHVTAMRAEVDPKVFTEIHVRFIFTGNNIKEKQVERALSLSAEKYCSASIMLAKTARIIHSYEIRSGG